MSSATRFAAVVSLVGLIMAARPAPHARSVGAATLTFFTDRAAFQASAPNLAVEDFEQGKVPTGGAMGCPGPLEGTSSNPCFPAGAIRAGVQFTSSPAHDACVTTCELALLGKGASSHVVDRKSTRLNSSHGYISYAVFCLKKKKTNAERPATASWSSMISLF